MHIAHCSSDGDISLLEHAKVSDVVGSAVKEPVAVGDWCVVKYNDKEFPGEVTNIINGHYEVNSIERCGRYFRWPSQRDQIFYNPIDLVKKLQGRPNVIMMGSRIMSVFMDFQ